ncbi:hypothetical protein ACWAUC_12095 [Bradyrhizobium guangdongense]
MMTSLQAGAGDLRLQIVVVDNNSRDRSVQVLLARSLVPLSRPVFEK